MESRGHLLFLSGPIQAVHVLAAAPGKLCTKAPVELEGDHLLASEACRQSGHRSQCWVEFARRRATMRRHPESSAA